MATNAKKITKALAKPKSDIELVCRLEPGWGAAFRRLRDAAGLSQSQLAELIECDTSSVSHWEAERFKPEAPTLRKALEALGVDQRILFRHFELPPEIRELINSQLSSEDAAIALGKILLDAGSNEEALGAIFDFMSPKVMAAVSLKALHDVQAAKLFFERQDRYTDDRGRKGRFNGAIDVTPMPAAFMTQRQSNSLTESSKEDNGGD
jgi:transcriptional regulator with XRE-family HTH domain